MNVFDFLTPKRTDLKLVRVGRNCDGGYVVPIDKINESEFYIGFGVGDDVSFEDGLLRIKAIDGRLYDGTVESIPVDLPIKFINENVYFERDGATCFDCSSPFVCKMDIEGEEYNLSKIGTDVFRLCSVFVVEIHFLDKHKEELINLCEYLDSCGLTCIHTHGNNNSWLCNVFNEIVPETLECTFVKSENNVLFSDEFRPIPGLDFKCNQYKPEVPLDFINNRIRRNYKE